MTSHQPASSLDAASSPTPAALRAAGAYRDALRDTEMKRAAHRLLSTRRHVWWAAAFAVAVGAGFGWACMMRTEDGTLVAIVGTAACVASVNFGLAAGANMMAHLWLKSLRRLDPMLPFLAPDVPLHQWAAAVLRGERHVPGEVEQALTTLWDNKSSEKDRALARLVLSRRGVPNVAQAPFRADPESRFPLWRRDVADGSSADLGPQCVAYLVGVADGMVLQQCPCGGRKAWDGGWVQRDLSWHGEPEASNQGSTA